MTVKPSIPAFENVYTTKETAVRLKVSASFLAKKRMSGGGPKFTKMGRIVRYPETAINEYLAARLRTSTSDPGPVSGTGSDEVQNAGEEEVVHPGQRRHSKHGPS